MHFPSQEEFLKLGQKGNLIPVYKEILGDLETPVSAYYKIAQSARYSFLLESVEGEEKVARFSFLAKDPDLILQTKDGSAQITRFEKNKPRTEYYAVKDSPLSFIRSILNQYQFVDIPGLPRFCGGMVGYLSYDVVRFFEKLPRKTSDDLKLPDALLMLAKHLVIFDHRNHKIKVVSCVHIDPKSSAHQKRTAYHQALQQIDQTIQELYQPLVITKKNIVPQNSSYKTSDLKKASVNLFCNFDKKPIKSGFKSNFSQAQFEKIVQEAKKQIRAGEIIQVVLSQRFEVDLKTAPFNIYRAYHCRYSDIVCHSKNN